MGPRRSASTARRAGGELPAALASKDGRLTRLRQAKALLEAEAAEREHRYQQRVAALAAPARGQGQAAPGAHDQQLRWVALVAPAGVVALAGLALGATDLLSWAVGVCVRSRWRSARGGPALPAV